MGFTEETVRFRLDDTNKQEINKTLTNVYRSLDEKGYNPINQIVGYARNQIRRYERDEIVEELVRFYLKENGIKL